MKRFLKSNIIVLIILVVFSITFLNVDYIAINEANQNIEHTYSIAHECEKIVKTSENQDEINACQEILKYQDIKIDFYTILSDVLVWKIQFIYYIAFLIVIIPSMYKVCKLLTRKHIINSNSRESYKSFFKKYLKTAYQYIWLLPLLSLILIIPIMLNSSLNPEYSNVFGTSIWRTNIVSNPFLFTLLYVIYMFLCSFIFINLALLVARKQQKFIPCVILSYIFYMTIEIFFEVVIRIFIFQKIFNSGFGILFNIINIFTFNDAYGIGTLLLLNLCFAVISFFFVWLTYKNKEKFVIQCEKNK